MSRTISLRMGLLAVSAVVLTTLAQAQYRASIQGVVTDQQGALKALVDGQLAKLA